jgi:FkbM family methyltransferase
VAPYFLKKLFLKTAIALPAPRVVYRLSRLYHHTKDGENFGDMTINGEVRFLRSQAPDCDVLFDVGANRGEWTRHALALTEEAQIHCFEPVSSLYRSLVANQLPERVVCNQVGLSDEPGERQIDLTTMSLYGHRQSPDSGPAPSLTEEVRLETLDAYCAGNGVEQIDLLKLDVEGHELAVMRGGLSMLREGRVRRIQFEYGPSNIYSRVLLRDMFAFFEDLDYDVFKIVPRDLVRVKTYDPQLENFQYKNFAALHSSLATKRG